MSSSSRPLSSSLVAVPESCAAASPYFSYSSTSSPHSAFSSSPSPSFSSSSSSSSHSSSSFSSTLPSSNFGSTSAEYYQQNHHHHHHQLPMMAASLDGSNMMKLYNSNGNSKLESFESNNSSWNGGLYGNGTTKVPAYQQQQSQPQQQLDQINFLVRKECCNEIDQAVKELGISADPFNWSVSDVQKWLLWMQRWVQLPSLKLEHFAMDGMSLCALTEEDFRQRVPNGEKLYAKLDIWRMAFNYFGATDFDSIFGEFQENLDNSNNSYGQQQQQQQQYCASPYSTSSSTDASSLYSGSSPISPEGYGVSNSGSGCGSLPTYAESMYGGGMCGNGSIASPASPASSSHSSVNSCSPYGQQQQNSYGYGQTMVAPQQQQQQQQQYGKASLLPMNDFSNMTNTGAMITAVVNGGGVQPLQQQRMVATSDYGSDAIPSDDDDMSDDEKCFLEFQHHHHRMTLQQQQQQQHQQQLMQLQQQQQQQQQMQSVVGNGRGSLPLSVPQIKVESRADYSPSTSPVYHQGLQHHQQHQHQQHLMQQQQQFGHPRPPVHHQQQHQQRQYAQHPNGMVVGNHSISVVKSELPSSSSSSTTTPIAVPAAPVPAAPAVAPVRTSSSHIHLWQFLKELLSGPHQYGSSIRWLDRSKGVFKIEDSVSVAKLWGARKNRPAMNYDKLSRSIRQYYKKGIMKKTERSQRLVYQFCAPYAL